MKQRRTFLLRSVYVLALLGHSTTAAQVQSIPLQHVLFKDSVVANRLTAFFAKEDAQATYLRVHKLQDTYICTIEELFYVEQVEWFHSSLWAEWQGRIVLIGTDQVYTSPNKVGQYSIFRPLANPDQFYVLTDRTLDSDLIKYARCIMPREVVRSVPVYKPRKGKKGYNRDAPPPPNIVEGPMEMFEVINGKAIDVYDIISPLPPPEDTPPKILSTAKPGKTGKH